MNQKNLQLGLGIAFGVYLYEVLTNLYNKLGFPGALTSVDWLRIFFIGLFSVLIMSLLNRSRPR